MTVCHRKITEVVELPADRQAMHQLSSSSLMSAPGIAPVPHQPRPPVLECLPAPTTGSDADVVDVCIVGLGYVGLPTALAFAAAGLSVRGYDIDQRRIDAIHAGNVDLLPRDLDRLAELGTDGRLSITDDRHALSQASTVVVCVPTPVDHHLVPDLRALRSACADVVAAARPGQLLMLTSTTYVGSTRDLLVAPLADRGLVAGVDLHVAFSPERIDPANVDFPVERTPRVVGGVTPACTKLAADVLRAVAPSVHEVSSPEVAELSKLHENTFRAVNIAYANELADICHDLGLSVSEVIDAAATKPYGFMAFRPGPGVGGHCIPCDPHYLLWQLRAQRSTPPVISTVMQEIAARPGRIVGQVEQAAARAGVPLRGARVLVVGVAYKPGVADVRESPALEIIERLVAAGADVQFTDAMVEEVRVGASVIRPTVDAPSQPWDVVLLHTPGRGEDLGWLDDVDTVVDATFRRAA